MGITLSFALLYSISIYVLKYCINKVKYNSSMGIIIIYKIIIGKVNEL